MTSMPLIYGSMVSPFVRKVLIALTLKNIAYTNQDVIPFIPEGKQVLLPMNPLGKVPVYQDGDFIISDSSVICAYLEKTHPAHTLYPTDPKSYAQCLWFEEYADTQLLPALATVFFNISVAPLLKIEQNMAAVEEALQKKIPPLFDYLESCVGDKKYIVGNSLTLADISITAPFINFQIAGQLIDANRWKQLSRYVNTLSDEAPIKEFNLMVQERMTKRSK